MTTIRISNVGKRFGTTRALDQVSLTIAAGELFFLLGPSGCGKTTLLRMLAGFVEPDEGDITFDDETGRPVSMKGVPPRLRRSSMVFQSYALWPHRSVARNVSYGLEVLGLGRAEIDRKVTDALKLVRLEGLGERKPAQLSGGQQQRVALARALVVRPRVLLLDEPLSNLDARLRLEMREEIRRIHTETKLTMVYVTHDQKEALSLADRLAVLHQGRLAQVGTPLDVYTRPHSRFVADFIGDSNFVSGTITELLGDGKARVQTPLGLLSGVTAGDAPRVGDEVTCSIRPEALAVGADRGENRFGASVEKVAFLGEVQYVHLKSNAIPLIALGLQSAALDVQPGATVPVSVPAEQVVVLAK